MTILNHNLSLGFGVSRAEKAQESYMGNPREELLACRA